MGRCKVCDQLVPIKPLGLWPGTRNSKYWPEPHPELGNDTGGPVCQGRGEAAVRPFPFSSLVVAGNLIALSLWWSCGCGPARARTADLSNDSDEMMWCVPARLEDGESVIACGYREETCTRFRASAIRWGGMYQVDEVGACDWREIGASE